MKSNITYTESGEREILNFIEEQKESFEDIILREKYVYGDEEIEVTGSDILKIKQRVRLSYQPKRLKLSSLKLASFLYLIIGIMTVIVGFVYQDFKDLLENNSEQAMIILVGVSISLIGGVLSIYMKIREKRIKEFESYNDEITRHNRVGSR